MPHEATYAKRQAGQVYWHLHIFEIFPYEKTLCWMATISSTFPSNRMI